MGLLKQAINIKEFNDWKVYLDDQMNKPSRSDYYMAQVAMEVRRTIAVKRNSLRLEQFLEPVKFVRGGKREKVLSVEESTMRAKAFFGALVGTTPRK